jgi:hypothetical protein
MPQLSVYLDQHTAERVDEAAREAGISRSRFVAEAVLDRLGAAWSPGTLALAGAWSEALTPRKFLEQIDAMNEQARIEREARYEREARERMLEEGTV